MIYKITLSISGKKFHPNNIIGKISGDFSIESSIQPNDKIFADREDTHDFGGISFWHPKKFSLQETIQKYEIDFIEFIESNQALFLENGVEEFSFFYEVYYEKSNQCNFEIFSKELLKRVSLLDLSFPVSIYGLGKNELKKWVKEVEIDWNK
jgi:hypothetical protein